MVQEQPVGATNDSKRSDYPEAYADSHRSTNIPELLERCRNLQQELETFSPERTRQLRNYIKSETQTLQRIEKQDLDEEKARHVLRSTNLTFYEAVWAATKRSTGVIAFGKRFYWDAPKRKHENGNSESDDSKTSKANSPKNKQQSAMVDIVAGGGSEWIKVSTLSEKRLLFELAKQGWERGAMEADSDDEWEAPSTLSDEGDELSLIRMAEDLMKASKATRVKYRHPYVRLVLPNIHRGKLEEIDSILSEVHATGVMVECAEDLEPAPPLADVMAKLMVNEFANFSEVLNVDCTILLALVSDLSHAKVEEQPWFHQAIKRQIRVEEGDQLMQTSLYPAMGAHPLVCTYEAAKRMREIVDTIGTASEKARTAIVMGDHGDDTHELLCLIRTYTEYPVPDCWKLPIKVVPEDHINTDLPEIERKVRPRLSAINQSVFFYGWSMGITTISSNRTVAKTIETVIEENRTSEDEAGPDIWLCPEARSLVGKQKGLR